MYFQYPLLLTLLLLLPLARRRGARRRWRWSTGLRLGMFVLAVLALARPYFRLPQTGIDLIVIQDQSASCAPEAGRAARELLALLRSTAGPGDRVAVIAFAEGARLLAPFDPGAEAAALPELPVHASDLAAALDLAANLRVPTRRTAALCLSDGLYTGRPPASPEVLASLAGLPVWHRNLDRARGADAAAAGIEVPGEVEAGGAWIVRYSLHANTPMTASHRLRRGGLTLASGQVELRKGLNHFFARDTAGAPGPLEYRLEVRADPDAIPENNHAAALSRVRGAARVLLVSDAAEPGLLARALEAAAIPFDRRPPRGFPRAAALLAPYRLAILENCRLADLPPEAGAVMAAAAEAGLTALWVAGGPNSFGPGGYHRSPLDPLLPVEMELRDDKRRGVMALAIALDRSGSMNAPADGGGVKMDVANLGAAESIRLLSPADEVAVFAVDTRAHMIVPLSRADATENLVAAVRRIASAGGGIYCRTAMRAAYGELEKSSLPTRHLVLFADASDAEEQEGALEYAGELRARGVGLSVIGMGRPEDRHGDFLRRLAEAGGGEALFSDRMDQLPSLFTREVIRVSQRGFVKETAAMRPLPPLAGLGVPAGRPLPGIDGYNVAALREGAACFIDLDDGFATPLMALRVKGRAAIGATLFEIDGEYSGAAAHWEGQPALLAAFARRLLSGVNHAEVGAYSSVRHGEGTVEAELSDELARRQRGRALSLDLLAPDGRRLSRPLRWTGPNTLAATIPLPAAGHYLPVVDLGEDGVAAAAALSLPYSAEFAPREDFAGKAALAGLGELTGGGEGLDMGAVRRSARALRTGLTELRGHLLALLLALFLAELAGRRFAWFS